MATACMNQVLARAEAVFLAVWPQVESLTFLGVVRLRRAEGPFFSFGCLDVPKSEQVLDLVL